MKSTAELKFLLTLLGCPDYRSALSAKRFASFKGKNALCKDLSDRNLVDFSREISSVKILPPGRALLKADPAQLPIAEKELKVLEKIAQSSGKISPSKIASLKATDRETILTALSERGLIEAETQTKRTKAEVWLTDRGVEFLRDDYNPQGKANISLDLLNLYVRFLRKSLRSTATSADSATTQLSKNESASNLKVEDLSDEVILKTIRDLDYEIGTDNYLPIFHLRRQLQPPLSREQLDQALYRLQRSDKIELSSLVDPTSYSADQVAAGIPQDVGGALFFITAN
jgi:predicted transcriptional regulator